MRHYSTLSSSPLASRLPAKLAARLEEACESALSGTELPRDVLVRHPGVSPYALQRLLHFFQTWGGPPENLVPVLPESSDAVQSYKAIIDIISGHLSGDDIKRSFPYALLVVRWMRGYPLSRIIQKNWEYRRKKGGNLPTVIRQTMADVETYARFRFPKYVSCYLDVLRHFLGDRESESLQAVRDLELWLEFGTSIQTQLSLIGLGLSRSSAVAVSEQIVSDSLDRGEALAWLKGIDLEAIDLPQAMVAEIAVVLAEHAHDIATRS